MKKLRSYSSIWKVEQVIHSFGDAKLPIPMTVTQIIWFISMELAVVMLKNVPPSRLRIIRCSCTAVFRLALHGL